MTKAPAPGSQSGPLPRGGAPDAVQILGVAGMPEIAAGSRPGGR